MGNFIRNRLAHGVTVVSNEFIDNYMARANGEYVKVFLYLLRHDGEEVTVSAIADALDHTEADVKRALAYWEEAGLLERGGDGDRPGPPVLRPGRSGCGAGQKNGGQKAGRE